MGDSAGVYVNYCKVHVTCDINISFKKNTFKECRLAGLNRYVAV